MRSTIRTLVAGLALLAVPGVACAAGSVSFQASGEQQVLVLLNQIRSHHGLPPFSVSAALHSAARAHSADMLEHAYFDHDSPGETWSARIVRYLRSPLIGEDLAIGRGYDGSATGLVSQWMHSPEHRAVILTPGLHRVGLGLAVGVWDGVGGAVLATADFAA